MPKYREKYGVAEDFIRGEAVLATKENLRILLNDETHNFGHDYCLAMAVLGLGVNGVR